MLATSKIIRLLVVDDSAFMRTAITRMAQSDKNLMVVGTACDGAEAIQKVRQLDPDVVTMDIEMPRMTGLEALRVIMRECPRAVIMISSLTQEGAEATFEALDCGAFDYIPKTLSYASLDITQIREDLILKIHAAHHAMQRRRQVAMPVAFPSPARAASETGSLKSTIAARRLLAVCIGISTGGPKALQQILPLLPADYPAGILVVQHMPPGFTGPFAHRLDSMCKLRVSEARTEDAIEPGRILIAPAGSQMIPYARGSAPFVRISRLPADTRHIPSVDVMMTAAAQAFGAATLGVIMTGMGNDGEAGMRAIRDAGGYTLGQDESSCAVYGMPRACAEKNLLQQIVSLTHLPAELCAVAGYRRVSALRAVPS
jgi:two-component system, chemotaxis family, protein-glutamate methylesterase/glutaminase